MMTATLTDGTTAIVLDGTLAMQYIHLFKKNHYSLEHLHTWGEAGTVKVKAATSTQLANKGV
eukprot:4502023-Ditylum_brightwellii.AAC.1